MLEDMSAALGRLKVLSQNMSFNLQEQKDMLEDTQNIAEDSSSRFGRVERKIDYVLNKAGMSNCVYMHVYYTFIGTAGCTRVHV